jgi:uncharacterized SAM-binding protein YcdF (DUF218 family)
VIRLLLVPGPLHVVALLLGVSVYAFRHRETRIGRARWLLIVAMVVVDVASTTPLANAVIARLEREHPAPTGRMTAGDGQPLIVVLSSGWARRRDGRWEVRLDEAGWERLHAGLRLWRDVGGRILFAGGSAPDGSASEAGLMAEIAAGCGVPPSAILVDPRSRTTYENLAISRELIAAHRGRVWLVTSAMHLPRALAVADKLGLRVEPYPCDHRAIQFRHWYAWLPDAGGAMLLGDALHEVLGLVWYRAKGWAR